MKYISYIWVSTKGHERIGLSFDAQKAIIEHYAEIDKAEILKEFIETESGKDISNRPILKAAIDYAQTHKAVLVVAKLDRLSRDVEQIFKIQKQLGAYFKSCDLPTTDAFTLSMYARIAQREREFITYQALQVKKRQGGKLSNLSNLKKVAKLQQLHYLKRQKTSQNNQRVAALIKVCHESGMSLSQIAEHLNNNGFTTSAGKKKQKNTVSRALK